MYFDLDESDACRVLVLRPTGELDMNSAPVLRYRLDQLRAAKRPVRLDLSGLEFIDSSGMSLLIEVFNATRASGWQLNIAPELSPQVERSLRLARLGRIVTGNSPGFD